LLRLDGVSCPTVDRCWAVGTDARGTAEVLSLPVDT